MISAGLGRYGPFLLHDGTYANLESVEDVFSDRPQPRRDGDCRKAGQGRDAAAGSPAALKELGEHPDRRRDHRARRPLRPLCQLGQGERDPAARARTRAVTVEEALVADRRTRPARRRQPKAKAAAKAAKARPTPSQGEGKAKAAAKAKTAKAKPAESQEGRPDARRHDEPAPDSGRPARTAAEAGAKPTASMASVPPRDVRAALHSPTSGPGLQARDRQGFRAEGRRPGRAEGICCKELEDRRHGRKAAQVAGRVPARCRRSRCSTSPPATRTAI